MVLYDEENLTERIKKKPHKVKDGFNWHMYGVKDIAGRISRSYYYCTMRLNGCRARRTVDVNKNCAADKMQIRYAGSHNHPPPTMSSREQRRRGLTVEDKLNSEFVTSSDVHNDPTSSTPTGSGNMCTGPLSSVTSDLTSSSQRPKKSVLEGGIVLDLSQKYMTESFLKSSDFTSTGCKSFAPAAVENTYPSLPNEGQGVCSTEVNSASIDIACKGPVIVGTARVGLECVDPTSAGRTTAGHTSTNAKRASPPSLELSRTGLLNIAPKYSGPSSVCPTISNSPCVGIVDADSTRNDQTTAVLPNSGGTTVRMWPSNLAVAQSSKHSFSHSSPVESPSSSSACDVSCAFADNPLESTSGDMMEDDASELYQCCELCGAPLVDKDDSVDEKVGQQWELLPLFPVQAKS
eukprot:TRINITY_DN1953_c0_g1_i1.p1 TRINITY_DN1953_c0_g1~~TRINITY_DN1953_c0_g1_i1.p1  ORF type:complete len:406 (+),score=6.95 TRINITY_DN1953_c0_g1_i1:260-1477(+)